jgi:D-alanine-D-alanine ligase
LQHLVNAPPDLVVPVGFGPPCEDGYIYSTARIAGVPCAGPGPLAGSLTLDKAALSRVVDALFPSACGVRSPRGVCVSTPMSLEELRNVTHHLKGKFVVKPNFSGSSENLFVLDSIEDVHTAIAQHIAIEGAMLVQELEFPVAHELSCTTLDIAGVPTFLPIVELRRDAEPVLTSELKFGKTATDQHIIPARISEQLSSRIEAAVMALNAAIGCVGLTRTDLLVLPSDEVVILEVNGIPGLLESSIACDAARAAGIAFDELAAHYAMSAFTRRVEAQVW